VVQVPMPISKQTVWQHGQTHKLRVIYTVRILYVGYAVC